jgi:hypothetical protein
MSCQFQTLHRSEVQRPVESKICQQCGHSFYRLSGSARTCCPKHREPPKRLVERDLSKHWTLEMVHYLKEIQ